MINEKERMIAVTKKDIVNFDQVMYRDANHLPFKAVDLKNRKKFYLLCPRCKKLGEFDLEDKVSNGKTQTLRIENIGNFMPGNCPWCGIDLLVIVKDNKLIDLRACENFASEMAKIIAKSIEFL